MSETASEVRQCEEHGNICGSQEPHPTEIYAQGVLCGGCGRRRKSAKYLLASGLAEQVDKLLDEQREKWVASYPKAWEFNGERKAVRSCCDGLKPLLKAAILNLENKP